MRECIIVQDAEALATAACERVIQYIDESVSARGRCVIALSGGSTPRALYHKLAQHPELPWDHVELCFGDERPVGPDDPQSNARMVREALTGRSFVPARNVHRMEGELPAETAALAYEDTLRRVFPKQSLPRFDLVLLGLGNDGHTASLFPHSPALAETGRWVVANWVESQGSHRITLTFPVLNAARVCLFLAAGADKAPAVQAVLESDAPVAQVPARGVQPTGGTLLFMLDRSSAGLLRTA